MIRMKRLHLINWHNFQDDIIDFKNITYLLGVNAVGKTTIMDAVRYCLTTNKDFNTAGNKERKNTSGFSSPKAKGTRILSSPGTYRFIYRNRVFG